MAERFLVDPLDSLELDSAVPDRVIPATGKRPPGGSAGN